MGIEHGHPTQRHLTAYATGAAGAGLSLAVAGHLTYCPDCRDAAVRAEALGGALVAEAAGAGAPPFAAVMARLDEPAPPPPHTPRAGPLPRPVAAAVGLDFNAIPWKFRLPGVREHVIADDGEQEISLLKARPGALIPQHTHEGEELTLVFAGALLDRDETYGPGDLAIADLDVDHHPRAGGDQDCVCLIVQEGRLRFTGVFGRALNIFNRT